MYPASSRFQGVLHGIASPTPSICRVSIPAAIGAAFPGILSASAGVGQGSRYYLRGASFQGAGFKVGGFPDLGKSKTFKPPAVIPPGLNLTPVLNWFRFVLGFDCLVSFPGMAYKMPQEIVHESFPGLAVGGEKHGHPVLFHD